MNEKITLRNELLDVCMKHDLSNAARFSALLGLAIEISLQEKTPHDVAALLRASASLEENRTVSTMTQ